MIAGPCKFPEKVERWRREQLGRFPPDRPLSDKPAPVA